MLWLFCKIKAQRQQDRVVIAQALVALEQGSSAAVWIAMIDGRPKGRPEQGLFLISYFSAALAPLGDMISIAHE